MKDEISTSGFRLIYGLSRGKTYVAISHSWTDRSGTGDSVQFLDLTPWPIHMSPAKTHLLAYLHDSQNTVDLDTGEPNSLWFWLDLFCIDQSKSDEGLFSQQLQQIPQVFWRALATFSLLVSRPCEEMKNLTVEYGELEPDDQYDKVCGLIKDHHTRCQCSPLVDSWFTRVWTRQELLYSKGIFFLTADKWAPRLSRNDCNWTTLPTTYIAPGILDGVRELAQCFHLWAVKGGLGQTRYGPEAISKMVHWIVSGQCVQEFLPSTLESFPASAGFFVLNWDMILNGSTRRTTYARDAILSQMLVLPGFVVPSKVWTWSLEDIAADAAKQFRQLIPNSQLVPTVMGADQSKNMDKLACSPSILPRPPQSDFCQIIQAVGTAQILPLHKQLDQNTDVPMLAYSTSWNYRVLATVDVKADPVSAAKDILSCQDVWASALDCRVKYNMLAAISHLELELNDYTSLESPKSGSKSIITSTGSLYRAAKHYLERLASRYEFNISTVTKSTDLHALYTLVEIDACQDLPSLLIEMTYCEAHGVPNLRTKQRAIMFGNVEVGTEGKLWGTGIATTTGLESFVIGRALENSEVSVLASGALACHEGLYAQNLKITRAMNGWAMPGKALPNLRAMIRKSG